MNNSTTTSTDVKSAFARTSSSNSDMAPMVITRLSGWIDIGESKSANPAWIMPTRITLPAK